MEAARPSSGMSLRTHSAASNGSGGPSIVQVPPTSSNDGSVLHEDVENTHSAARSNSCDTALLRELAPLRRDNRVHSCTKSGPVPIMTVASPPVAAEPSPRVHSGHNPVTTVARVAKRTERPSITARRVSEVITRKPRAVGIDKILKAGKRRR